MAASCSTSCGKFYAHQSSTCKRLLGQVKILYAHASSEYDRHQVMIREQNRCFLKGRRIARFEAIQNCLVPRSMQFSPEQKEHSIALINQILADKPGLIHLKIAVFLRFIDLISLISGLKSFRHLAASRQIQVMRFFFDSKISLFRKGFWGLSTLAKMGVYGQASVYDEIGYKLKETPQ